MYLRTADSLCGFFFARFECAIGLPSAGKPQHNDQAKVGQEEQGAQNQPLIGRHKCANSRGLCLLFVASKWVKVYAQIAVNVEYE